MEPTVLMIGSTRETHEAAADSICRILKQGVDQETLREALAVYAQVAEVKNVTIDHCHISGSRTINVDMEDLKIRED